jgi:hypothetical protein
VRAAFAALTVLALGLTACGPKLPEGVDEAQLSEAVGRAIGGPNTCVLIGDAKGRQAWRGGAYVSCARNLPACDGATTTTENALKAWAGKPARFVSCPSSADGVNSVGWAMGPVPTGEGKPPRNLSYVAMMEGDRALPGREVQERVERAFKKAGF